MQLWDVGVPSRILATVPHTHPVEMYLFIISQIAMKWYFIVIFMCGSTITNEFHYILICIGYWISPHEVIILNFVLGQFSVAFLPYKIL